jgi:hypothetical protein
VDGEKEEAADYRQYRGMICQNATRVLRFSGPNCKIAWRSPTTPFSSCAGLGAVAPLESTCWQRPGFKNVHNIVDGMEGDTVEDPDSVFAGQRLKNGWKNSGCSWTYKLTPDRMLMPRN